MQNPASVAGVKTETAEEEIRRVVTESQLYETLFIYGNPAGFDKGKLLEYWVPESKGGKAIVQVQNAVRRLLDRRWHYSKESKNEEFVIRSITFFAPGDVADVTTRERWYVPMVDEQGRLVKDREATLEYSIRYRVVKIDGRWLLLLNSTPYRDRN